MIFNLYDEINFVVCLWVTTYCAIKFEFSNKVVFLLLLHLLLVAFIDLGLPYDYMPDQFRYAVAAKEFRHQFYTHDFSTVKYASLIFAMFPLLIESVKSIAFMNYLIYLGIFIFVLIRIHDKTHALFFKAFYLCYPSLILYSSLGLRDMLILVLMLIVLYYAFIQFNQVIIVIALGVLFLIKPQNSIILCFTLGFGYVLRLKKTYQMVLLIVFFVGCYLFLHKFGAKLDFYRAAMYNEDTGLPGELVPDFTYLDIFNYFTKPFMLTARNNFQIIQSCENVLLFFPLAMIIYIRILNKRFWCYSYLEFMLLSSCIIYSYVVANYGTLARYKFPFIVCYIVINLLSLYSKRLSRGKLSKWK